MYGEITTNGVYWFVDDSNSDGTASVKRFDTETQAIEYRDYQLDKMDKIIKYTRYVVNGTEFETLKEAEDYLDRQMEFVKRREILRKSNISMDAFEIDAVAKNWDNLKEIMDA